MHRLKEGVHLFLRQIGDRAFFGSEIKQGILNAVQAGGDTFGIHLVEDLHEGSHQVGIILQFKVVLHVLSSMVILAYADSAALELVFEQALEVRAQL